jgi:integrase
LQGRESGVGAWELWEKWISEKKPKAATIDRWRAVFLNIEEVFQNQDANCITEDDARRWAGSLVTEERSAQTVQEVWINAAKTIFGWAKTQKLIDTNPFETIKITVPKKVKNRETKAFRGGEITTILRGTLQTPPSRLASHYVALRRWVPWICAYTGSRAGEITQLRQEDVIQRDGVWALRLTPEAGTIKTGEARIVPIHEHLIEQGLLDFVKKAGRGPLFYDPNARRKTGVDDPTKPGQSQAVKSRTKLAEWVRTLGIDDPELSPTHAWRHTFKQIADRHGISERVSDAITGHSPQTEGRKYGQPTLVDMAEALKRFPRYQV